MKIKIQELTSSIENAKQQLKNKLKLFNISIQEDFPLRKLISLIPFSFKKLNNLKRLKKNHKATVWGKEIFYSGGDQVTPSGRYYATKHIDSFNPYNNTETTCTDMLNPRKSHSSALVSDGILITGDTDPYDYGFTQETRLFTTGRFVTEPNYPETIYGHVAISVEEGVLFFGNWRANSNYQRLYNYKTGTFTQKSNALANLYNHAGDRGKDNVIIGGGSGSYGRQFSYSIKQDITSELVKLPSGKQWHTAVNTNSVNDEYIIIQYNGGNDTKNDFKYNEKNGTFTTTTPLDFPIYRLTAVVIENNIIYTGGENKDGTGSAEQKLYSINTDKFI